MAALITTDDLKTNALWLAGEPTDGTSDYDAQALTWMQLIYNTFVNGGTTGTRDVAQAAGLYEHLVDIPTNDWLWLRKFPPFAFVTTPAILGSGAGVATSSPPPVVIGTVTLTNGSPTISFSTAPAVSVAGWRLKLITQASGIINVPITVPRIVTHIAGATTAVLDTNWPQETQTASDFVLFQSEYDLPTDFVRFCEAPAVQGGYAGGNPPRLNIGSPEQVQTYFPLTEINQGPPSAASRVTPGTIQLNRWDTQSYRIEFTYIATPPVLVVGALTPQVPLIPERYRHVLSLGSAMQMAHDKVDSRANSLSSQFREILVHMGNEYRHENVAGSTLAGRQLYRQSRNRRGLLRTSHGLPLF